MKKVSYEQMPIIADMAVYAGLMTENNEAQMNRLKRNLVRAMHKDITPRQRQYLAMYYGKSMNIPEIAREVGVNKSSVCRTLQRGRQRLYRCLRYGASNLLEQAEK
jgi:RNA polymerase sigma-70 factor (ECF subfamily)